MVKLREERRLSFWNNLALWLHYVVIVALLVGTFAKYISPILTWIPAFFGLAFPFLFILNLIFIIYWLAQFKTPFIFGFLAMALAIPTAYRYVQITFPRDDKEEKTLRVTTYNSMLFDLYNWSGNSEARNRIFADLQDINPDILCLQEFYTSEEENDFNNIDTLKQILNAPFHHNAYTVTLRKFDHWGIATFSKHPIINEGTIAFNTRSNNICIYSDIVVGRDTLRVYNVHLQSVSFSSGDNLFLSEIKSEKEATDKLEKSKNILRRLKNAFIKRAYQVDMIAAHMKICPYKIILCGDFNETAASYAYEKLAKHLEDSFIEKGYGFGRTYAGKWPQFRIDYILHSKDLRCEKYERASETLTDHYAITSTFAGIRW